MKKNVLKMVAYNAIIAAIYAALTIALAPISYGGIQFRFAEVLVLLVLYNPRYGFGVTLGCFVANCFSDFGVIDMVFGTMATVLSILPMLKVKNKYIASLFPVFFNGLIVGLELYFLIDLPFWIGALEVALGEFVCVSIIGTAVFTAIEKNPMLVEMMELKVPVQKENSITKFFDFYKSITLALSVVMICLYFALPMWSESVLVGTVDEYSVNYSMFAITFGLEDANGSFSLQGAHYLILLGIIPILLWIVQSFLNKKSAFLLGIGLVAGMVALWIVLGVKNLEASKSITYYCYLIPSILYILIMYFSFKKIKKIEALV